jgi:hypothetical protein
MGHPVKQVYQLLGVFPFLPGRVGLVPEDHEPGVGGATNRPDRFARCPMGMLLAIA